MTRNQSCSDFINFDFEMTITIFFRLIGALDYNAQ